MSTKGMIFDIQHGSFVDGPGMRTSVFFKGCNLRCAWCHNPESQSFQPERLFYEEKCTHCGLCEQVCPTGTADCKLCGLCQRYCEAGARKICGREYSVDALMDELLADRDFYSSTGGGITFSGGEPMLQPDFLVQVLECCAQEGIHTAVDTAGHVDWAVFERILPVTDLFLYDIKCMDTKQHRIYTGAGNERILDNLARLLDSGKPVWIRIPVVAGVNDSVEEMELIAAFLRAHRWPERVELLPYHAMGEEKLRALRRPPAQFTGPDTEHMCRLRSVFDKERSASGGKSGMTGGKII